MIALDRFASPLARAQHWVENLADFRLPHGGGEVARAERIGTVILPLGPYRNLTTLTAALYALHPNAVVLNHAAERVFGTACDPFGAIGDDSWRRFKVCALRLMRRGQSGRYGGSVLKSHAFQESDLPAVYARLYGDRIVKADARVLFWKDSMRLQNRFMADEAKFARFLAVQPQAKFIYPVRNPLDCARSNLQRGHWRHLAPQGGAQFEPVLVRILESLRWFRFHERAEPDRFLSFSELELDGDFPDRLARFSKLPHSRAWTEEIAPQALEIKGRTRHDADKAALYARLVEEIFADDPEMAARLRRLC